MLVYCHCSVACQRGGSRFEKMAALPLLARIVTTYREPPVPRMPIYGGFTARHGTTLRCDWVPVSLQRARGPD